MVIEKFYHQAHLGEHIDVSEITQYLTSFENIILWGAGNLGAAVGKKLLDLHIPITEYWDRNAENIVQRNRRDVKIPFHMIFDKDTTLIIPCIVNGSLGDKWAKDKVITEGYIHSLNGMALYEAIICPFFQDTPFDISVCTQSKACSLCNCIKYTSLIKQKNKLKGILFFQLITFIISTRCTLNCKYCGQWLTKYKSHQKIDFSVDRIIADIDNFSGAVDFVGMVSLIGGEPFIHQDLYEIALHCLTKGNFGVINITTNGICKMTHELLTRLKNPRVKISFSIYDKFLTDTQKELLNKNIMMVKDSGISYSLSYPLWVLPHKLEDYHYSIDHMKQLKSSCENIKMCAAVKNGKFLPCSISDNVMSLGIFQTQTHVDVTNNENLRGRILELLNKEYYDVCSFCNTAPIEIPAGEQEN